MTVTAEAVASHASCDNEIVSVPERGRIDTVTRSLIVKVKTRQPTMLSWPCEQSCVIILMFLFQAEGLEMTKIHNWLLCPKGQSSSPPLCPLLVVWSPLFNALKLKLLLIDKTIRSATWYK